MGCYFLKDKTNTARVQEQKCDFSHKSSLPPYLSIHIELVFDLYDLIATFHAMAPKKRSLFAVEENKWVWEIIPPPPFPYSSKKRYEVMLCGISRWELTTMTA